MSNSPDMSTNAVIFTTSSNGLEVSGEEAQMVQGAKAVSGTKLYLSNLDHGVCDEDLEALFSDYGELLRYSIHNDRKGRSMGTGELIFARKSDALAAIKRYNNVRLDGKPMKFELVVGVSDSSPAAMPPATKDLVENENPFRRKIPKDGAVLDRLRKGRHESLRNYVRRYWEMYDEVDKDTCPELLAIVYFKRSLPPGDLRNALFMNRVSSIVELHSIVSRHVQFEDALGRKRYAARCEAI